MGDGGTGSAPQQIQHADGRVELDPAAAALPGNGFTNDDLRPVPVARRTWTTYNFLALWVGMAHNIPSWTLASGLVALGMDWKQAVLTIALANLIVLVPMLLTSSISKVQRAAPHRVRAAGGMPVASSSTRSMRPSRLVDSLSIINIIATGSAAARSVLRTSSI
ncbi:cytosine permease [Kitasatospora sp. NPDC047058]|uniref:cytosine permease n=1 Tax=Kitasatospora sp. NPDC047058 TaxID=3155620 RepID=UPI0033CC1295